jgi:hypothetical protein
VTDDPGVFEISPNNGSLTGPSVSAVSATGAPPKDLNRGYAYIFFYLFIDEYVFIYVHLYTYIYIYIYRCVCISVLLFLYVHIPYFLGFKRIAKDVNTLN